MAYKRIIHKDFGEITIYKKKHARGLRISIAHNGKIRVSMPKWLPFKLGEKFIYENNKWLVSNYKKKQTLNHGDVIGKNHILLFETSIKLEKPRSRITNEHIIIKLPSQLEPDDKKAQDLASRACIKALKKQADQLLADRITFLASEHGFVFRIFSLRQMTTRWGSCNQKKEIVLNTFLIQLPWSLIDYVILHELAHTKILAHGKKFWSELDKYVDDLPSKRKFIKNYRPALYVGDEWIKQ